MRRAFANRSMFNFGEALKDLKTLKKVMNPDDAALKEVDKMYKSCWRGICQENEVIPPIGTRRMMRETQSWINGYRALTDAASKVTFLKKYDCEKLHDTFRNLPVPRCIFADLVEALDTSCHSLEELSWV